MINQRGDNSTKDKNTVSNNQKEIIQGIKDGSIDATKIQTEFDYEPDANSVSGPKDNIPKEHMETVDNEPKSTSVTSTKQHKIIRYNKADAEYMDKDLLTTKQSANMLDAFENKVILQQYSSDGKLYFNPNGIVTIADVVNGLADRSRNLAYDSEDGVSTHYDFFNNGYNQLFENINNSDSPGLKPQITREMLFMTAPVEIVKFLIKIRYPEISGATMTTIESTLDTQNSNFVTRLQLVSIIKSIEVM